MEAAQLESDGAPVLDVPLRLRPRLARSLRLFFVALAFAATGIWMLSAGKQAGWLPAIFFGLGAVVAAVNLLPGASYLELRRDGFLLCSLYRQSLTRWSEVERFTASSILVGGLLRRRHEMVGVVYRPTPEGAKLRGFSAALTGLEGGLPDLYGKKVEALAALMNRWLEAAREESGETALARERARRATS